MSRTPAQFGAREVSRHGFSQAECGAGMITLLIEPRHPPFGVHAHQAQEGCRNVRRCERLGPQVKRSQAFHEAGKAAVRAPLGLRGRPAAPEDARGAQRRRRLGPGLRRRGEAPRQEGGGGDGRQAGRVQAQGRSEAALGVRSRDDLPHRDERLRRLCDDCPRRAVGLRRGKRNPVPQASCDGGAEASPAGNDGGKA